MFNRFALAALVLGAITLVGLLGTRDTRADSNPCNPPRTAYTIAGGGGKIVDPPQVGVHATTAWLEPIGAVTVSGNNLHIRLDRGDSRVKVGFSRVPGQLSKVFAQVTNPDGTWYNKFYYTVPDGTGWYHFQVSKAVDVYNRKVDIIFNYTVIDTIDLGYAWFPIAGAMSVETSNNADQWFQAPHKEMVGGYVYYYDAWHGIEPSTPGHYFYNTDPGDLLLYQYSDRDLDVEDWDC